MEMFDLLSKVSLKDWLIVVTFGILIFCLFEIQRLKKVIARDSRKNLTPQLMLDLILEGGEEETGIYLKNESFFIAQDIRLETLQLALDDFGFTSKFIIEFESIEALRPQERRQLHFKVLDRDQQFLPEATEKILPHLISPTFKVSILYTNIEGMKFRTTLLKKGKGFYHEKIELLPEKK